MIMKKRFSLIILMALLSMGVQAGDVLYGEIDGTNMIVKCGDFAPEGSVLLRSWESKVSISIRKSITSVTIDTSCTSYTGTSLDHLFAEFEKLKTITGLSNLNTTNVTSTAYMFYYCCSLSSLDFSGFNTTSITAMSGMFHGCSALTSLDLSSFNTTNIKYMDFMFHGCMMLTSLDVSSFNTSNVIAMSFMFGYCNYLSSLDLSAFNTVNVVHMDNMFTHCYALTTIYVGDWNTDNVRYDSEIFTHCSKLVGGAGTRYDEKHTDKEYARIDGGPSAPGYFTDIKTKALGIKDVTKSKMTEFHTPIYNLQGQQLTSAPQKGIYIQNGKKVIIKK